MDTSPDTPPHKPPHKPPDTPPGTPPEKPPPKTTWLVLPRPPSDWPPDRCWAGIIAGAVTGLLAGIGVGIPLGSTIFDDGDKVSPIVGFISVVIFLSLVGLVGGTWGGALTAKCWDDPRQSTGSPS
jgi:hypothetical protein